MNLADLLPEGSLDALTQQLGISREDAERGAQALVPSLIGSIDGKTAAPVEPAGLAAQVQALGGSGLIDNVVGSSPTDTGLGNQLLASLFGSKDVSREVAGKASQATGLDPAILKKMLPILAMLVAGHLAKRSGGGQQGGLESILGSIAGALAGSGGSSGSAASAGGLGGILGSILGGR